MDLLTLINGECVTALRALPANSVPCCVTSPPYWQKRDYGHAEQIGQETTPEDFVDSLVTVFDQVRRVLTPGGSLWLNLGDSYAAGGNGGGGSLRKRRGQWRAIVGRKGWRKAPPGYKSKDLTLVPFLVAFALRERGWYLRQTIIWWRGVANEPNRLDRPAADGHPAPMPAELARRCIVAGSKVGDEVLDPFGGSGTTAMVALELARRALLIELNPDYCAIIRQRCAITPGLALSA